MARRTVPLAEYWATERARRIGASEVAALMGDSAYHQPVNIYDRLAGTEVREPNEAMRIGSLLDNMGVFVPMLKWRGIVARKAHLAWLHPTLPLSAAPDLLVNAHMTNPRGLVECKVSNATLPKGECPPWWYWQVQTQLGLSQRAMGYLAVLKGSTFTVIEVPFSEADYAAVLAAVSDFNDRYLVPHIRPDDEFIIQAPAAKG